MTRHELLIGAEQTLREAGVAEYQTDAWYLFSEAFSEGRAEYYLHCEEEAPADREEDFLRTVRQRAKRIPLQQIIGYQSFMGLDFTVNKYVLIPRQDTEILVETVLNELPELYKEGDCKEPIKVLDLCAGSGCIGISIERLAKAPVDVLASDVSARALEVAGLNAGKLGCMHYRTVKSDLFEQIEGTFSVIVSNPPYIASAVVGTLEEEVRLHEPILALDGGVDGLDFYRRIIAKAVQYLDDNGRIYLEIGYDQGDAVRGLLTDDGWIDVRIVRDLAGLDRVVTARRQALEE